VSENGGWLERETMVGTSTIAEANTFRPETLLLLLIDYFEAKCFLSQVNTRWQLAIGLFPPTLKSIEREERRFLRHCWAEKGNLFLSLRVERPYGTLCCVGQLKRVPIFFMAG